MIFFDKRKVITYLFNFERFHFEIFQNYCGGIAQLGEHLPCTQGVKGSIPLFSTIDHKDQEDMYLEN